MFEYRHRDGSWCHAFFSNEFAQVIEYAHRNLCPVRETDDSSIIVREYHPNVPDVLKPVSDEEYENLTPAKVTRIRYEGMDMVSHCDCPCCQRH